MCVRESKDIDENIKSWILKFGVWLDFKVADLKRLGGLGVSLGEFLNGGVSRGFLSKILREALMLCATAQR